MRTGRLEAFSDRRQHRRNRGEPMTSQPSPSLSPMSTPEPWQLVAEGYAAEASLVMAPFSMRAIELLAPTPSARVLDVAAGPGTLATRLAPTVRELVALDFSERMVAEL